VELVAGVHADDDQFGLAAKRPVALPQRLLIFSGPTEQSMAEALMQFQPGLTPTPDPQTEG
jgi:hypothetical protein